MSNNLAVLKLRIKSFDYSEGDPGKAGAENSFSISCSDSITIKGSSENWTSFYYTREIKMTPGPVFTLLAVVFAIVANVDKKGPAPTESDILNELRSDNCSISQIPAQVSLMVSQITSQNARFPMITPPTFVELKSGKTEK